MSPRAVHSGISKGLYAVAATQSDEQLARPGIGNGELELLGLFLLACGLELAPDTVCRCTRGGFFSDGRGAGVKSIDLVQLLAKAILG